MPIELKGLNYYSKVFKRFNYRLSNSTFWVVIRPRMGMEDIPYNPSIPNTRCYQFLKITSTILKFEILILCDLLTYFFSQIEYAKFHSRKCCHNLHDHKFLRGHIISILWDIIVLILRIFVITLFNQ